MQETTPQAHDAKAVHPKPKKSRKLKLSKKTTRVLAVMALAAALLTLAFFAGDRRGARRQRALDQKNTQNTAARSSSDTARRFSTIGNVIEVSDKSVKIKDTKGKEQVITINKETAITDKTAKKVEVDAADDDITAEVIIEDVYSQMFVTGFYNVGGLIGEVDVYNDEYDNAIASFELSRAYSSGDVLGVENVGGVVGYIDYNEYEGESVTFTDVFSASDVSDESEGEGTNISGFAGFYDLDDVPVDSTNIFYDSNGDTLDCSGDNDLDDCTGIDESDQTNYFIGNSTNAPMDEWDFENVWYEVENDYPQLLGSNYERPEVEENDDGPIVLYADLNGDGTDDSEQPNVGGYLRGSTGKIVAMDMGTNCELTGDDMAEEADFDIADPAYEYDDDLFEFTADCAVETTTIKLYYYDVDITGLIARKYSTKTNSYFTLDDAVLEQKTINGHSVAVVTYQLKDNSERDMDDEVGSIEDPAGLARNIVGVPNTGVR